jgi:predicted  nucleic acid-binding Zn-ribbon protein
VLERDLQRLAIESSHSQNALQPMAQELPNIKKSIGEQNGFVDGMENNQENGEQDISSMKPLFENLTSSNYDGTMIWKINNVKEKIG